MDPVFASRTLLSLLVILDPVGIVPMFLAVTSGRAETERRRIARTAVLVAGGVLLLFAFLGEFLLGKLGITLDAFRVAGGILLFMIAVGMVFAQNLRDTSEERAEAAHRDDVAVFPLAIPIIAGPGTLTTLMILVGESRGVEGGGAIVAVTAAAVLALCWLAMRLSDGISRLLGRTGVNVVTRVLGVLLAALAVQYVADGVRALLWP